MIQRVCRPWHPHSVLPLAARLHVAVLALLLVTVPAAAQTSEPDEVDDPLADLKPVMVVNFGQCRPRAVDDRLRSQQC